MNARHPTVVRIGSSLHQSPAFEPLYHASDCRRLDAESVGERCLTQSRFFPHLAEQHILASVHAVGGQQVRQMGTMSARQTVQRQAERCGHRWRPMGAGVSGSRIEVRIHR